MSEIVCPSCGARYRVPQGAIGPQGRRVHCSACGEVWRARVEPEPTLIAASQPEGDTPAAPPGVAETVGAETVGAGAGAAFAGAAASGAAAAGHETVEQAARRRKSWRDLAEEHGPAGGAAPAEDPEPGQSGQDAFAARLARLRETDAPEPEGEEGRGRAAELMARRSKAAEARVAPDAPAAGSEADGNGAGGNGAGPAVPPAATDPRLPRREAGSPEIDTGASRDEQMAEIRRMLNQLQSPGTEESGEEDADAFKGVRDVAGIERMAPAREEYRDPLREQLLDPDASRTGPPRWKSEGNYERDGLMRKHRKRNRRRQIAEKTRRSRGGFLTGFLLVLLAGGLLLGVYAFHEQIIARAPGTEPALRDYVAAVEDLRGQAAQGIDHVRERAEQVIEEMQ